MARKLEEYVELAMRAAKANDWSKIVDITGRATKEHPGAAVLWHMAGIAESQLGNGDTAIRHFRHALALEPKEAEHHGALGAALIRAGNANEAIGCFRRALQLEPHPRHELSLAQLLLQNGDVEGARQHVGHAQPTEPELIELHRKLRLALRAIDAPQIDSEAESRFTGRPSIAIGAALIAIVLRLVGSDNKKFCNHSRSRNLRRLRSGLSVSRPL